MAAHGAGPLNDARRLALAECIFAEESELENRLPLHPKVAVMRAVRAILLDDAGVNETRGQRWPHIEAVAARMTPRRRSGAAAG